MKSGIFDIVRVPMASFPSKPAKTEVPILDVLQERWSPVHFSEEPLSDKQVATLFEAARWAPSSFNEQPWLYVYAQTNDGEKREKLHGLLADGNAWAKKAGLLILSFSKKTFARNDKPNRHHMHDLGAASMSLVLQATKMGLVSHQMAGFDVENANQVLGVPEEYEPGSMIAIGYTGDPKKISPEHKKREEGARERKKTEEFVHRGSFKK